MFYTTSGGCMWASFNSLPKIERLTPSRAGRGRGGEEVVSSLKLSACDLIEPLPNLVVGSDAVSIEESS